MKKPNKPSNHMLWAILSTMVCFPMGILIIFNAIKVDSLYKSGDVIGARHRSDFVKRYALYTIEGCLVLVAMVYLTLLYWEKTDSHCLK